MVFDDQPSVPDEANQQDLAVLFPTLASAANCPPLDNFTPHLPPRLESHCNTPTPTSSSGRPLYESTPNGSTFNAASEILQTHARFSPLLPQFNDTSRPVTPFGFGFGWPSPRS
ncbi:uncharacterized protein JCM6883_000954 [Sporobolomyces salmoneus]|uniref:uncharacterized protein n=1 Tax=Sporobolomyces salmoneus TaxID=183962 RepID=UPI0031825881